MGGRRDIFVLLGGENVGSNQMNLGMSVLSSLGSGHVNNLDEIQIEKEGEEGKVRIRNRGQSVEEETAARERASNSNKVRFT